MGGGKMKPLTFGAWRRCECKKHVRVLQTAMDPPSVTPEGEKNRIVASFVVFNVPPDVQQLILEAINSTEWKWFEDCDGCTGVSEEYWPTKYFPPCLRHDFDWATGRGGPASNDRFYRIQRIYGIPAFGAGVRWLGVTIAWWTWSKWRKMFEKAVK